MIENINTQYNNIQQKCIIIAAYIYFTCLIQIALLYVLLLKYKIYIYIVVHEIDQLWSDDIIAKTPTEIEYDVHNISTLYNTARAEQARLHIERPFAWFVYYIIIVEIITIRI